MHSESFAVRSKFGGPSLSTFARRCTYQPSSDDPACCACQEGYFQIYWWTWCGSSGQLKLNRFYDRLYEPSMWLQWRDDENNQPALMVPKTVMHLSEQVIIRGDLGINGLGTFRKCFLNCIELLVESFFLLVIGRPRYYVAQYYWGFPYPGTKYAS